MKKPFTIIATPADDLVAVRNRARIARRAKPNQPVVVELAGGVYRLAKTLELTGVDSGVTWRSRKGDRAVLSGGIPLSGWRQDTVNGKPCWITDVEKGWTFTQLWVDGRRRSWSRFPAIGFHKFSGLDGQGDSGDKWMKGPDRAEFKAGDIDPSWRNREDIRLVAYQLWFDTHHRISEIDNERRVVTFLARSLGSLIDERAEFARYVCLNVFEALTEPGTWYLDRPSGRVYYLPLEGEELSLPEIVAPRLSDLVVLAGSEKSPVRDVLFENISFQHADFDRAPDSPGSMQAAFDLPGAVRMRWAEDCVFYGCEVAHVGQYGLQVETGSVRPVVAACTFHDLGGGGIRVDHEELKTHNSVVGEEALLARPEPIAATIIDCVIHDNGKRYPSSVGIFLGNSGFHRVLHNHLHDLTYTGISAGWIWGYKPSRTFAVRIAHNHIHHVNHDRLLSDNGAIYTLGRQPGGSLVGNLITDIGCYGYGGWGLYNDEGSSEMDMHSNVVLRTKHAAYHMHYGRACNLHDNLFAASAEAHFQFSKSEMHRSLTVRDNVMVGADGKWHPSINLPQQHLLWLNNVIFDPRRPPISERQLEEHRALGQHRGLKMVDPLLRDAFGGDPTPRADSPVKRIGRTVRVARLAGLRPLTVMPENFSTFPIPADRPFPIVETDVVPLGDPVQSADGSHRVVFRATFRNPGLIKARAAVRFIPGVGSVKGSDRFDAHLAPGIAKSMDVAVIIPTGEPMAMLATKPIAGPAVAHQVFVMLVNAGRAVTLPRLPATTTVEELARALARQPINDTRFWGPTGAVCAQLRLAIIGDAVALHAEVPDACMHHGSAPWLGSCIELFAAASDGGDTVGQLAIQPELSGVPAKATLIRRGEISQVVIPTRTKRTAKGYALSALVPLDVLGVGSVSAFRLEIAVTTTRGPGSQPERSAWVHATQPYRSGSVMARITVTG